MFCEYQMNIQPFHLTQNYNNLQKVFLYFAVIAIDFLILLFSKICPMVALLLKLPIYLHNLI